MFFLKKKEFKYKDEVTALINDSTSLLHEKINALELEIKELKTRELNKQINNNLVEIMSVHSLLYSMHNNITQYLYTYKTIKLSIVLKLRDMYLDGLKSKYKNPNFKFNKKLNEGFLLPLFQLYDFSIRIVDDNDNDNVIFDGYDVEIRKKFKDACNNRCSWKEYPYICLKKLVKSVPDIMFGLYVPDTISGEFGMRIEDYVEML